MFIEVAGYTTLYTLNTVTISSNIKSGFNYRLRYRCHNVYGWSDFSPIVNVMAATLPGATIQPNSTIVGTNVSFSWLAPTNTGGLNVAITYYFVEVLLAN